MSHRDGTVEITESAHGGSDQIGLVSESARCRAACRDMEGLAVRLVGHGPDRWVFEGVELVGEMAANVRHVSLLDAAREVCPWCHGDRGADHVDVHWSAERREYMHQDDYQEKPCDAARIHALIAKEAE